MPSARSFALLLPVRHLGHRLDDGLRARVVLGELETVGERIDAPRLRDLVQERLAHELVVARADAAPGVHAHAALLADRIGLQVRDLVELLAHPDPADVVAAAGRRKARRSRHRVDVLGDDPVMPARPVRSCRRDRPSSRDASSAAAAPRRCRPRGSAISFTGFLTMLEITAACTGASGQMRRPKPPPSSCRLILILSGVVLSTFATTAAASGCTCVPTQISTDVPSSRHLRDGVHRLHLGVIGVLGPVGRLQRLRRAGQRLVGIADLERLLDLGVGVLGLAGVFLLGLFGIERRRGGSARVPLDLERHAAGAARLDRVGDHGDAERQRTARG